MANRIKYAFRMVHIKNMSHILSCGFVTSKSEKAYPNYVPIGDPEVINKRRGRVQGIDLADYIPFYFGPRSPMLYVIQHGYNNVKKIDAKDIVYCVVRIDDLVNNCVDCVFTDGHAIDSLTNFHPSDKLRKIDDIICYEDVYAINWKNNEHDPDIKRRKEAELLVKDHLPIYFIVGYVVYNDEAKNHLIELGVEEKKIAVRPNYYY